ncbi:MAG: NAD(P)/FAD-dependent oxidoreductase [Actinobacteria bacterium]|nr:NAD(P)/FAD-dependent oxidoreductase [Actinomycetota bacterium]
MSNTNGPQKRVAIVGSGVSGLAHADVLTRCGFACVLFERSPRAGGVWAHSYSGVSLQNTGHGYHFSSFPWPSEPDLHPTGEQILRYVDALIAAREFDVRVGHEVVTAHERDEGWDVTVRITSGNGREPEERTDRFDHVVVSIGQYTEGKHRPQLDGEEAFSGRIVTERDVQDLEMFDGARVIVVGFGKSALDMTTFAVSRAAEVHHVFRTPRWTLPRTILGVHYTKLLFSRFGSVMMTSWAHPTPAERFLHRRTRFVGSFWSGMEKLFTSIAHRQGRGTGAAGKARLATVFPPHSLLADLRSAAALAPPEYHGHVARGEIVPHHSEMQGLTGEGLRLTDGSVIPADIIVMSVGSLPPTFPFLEPDVRTLLESEDDGPQLYRHVLHPRLPSLAFAGYNHCFMHIPAAEIAALWLAALWQGRLETPSPDEMERVVEHVRGWKRANIHFEPSRSCAVNTRFQQYLDIMLADLGISPYRKLPNVLAEVFAAYGAADYAGVVDEYLAHSPRRRYRPSSLAT